MHVDGTLDLADALALDATVTTRAHQLLAEHPELPLRVRRAMAAGTLGNPDPDGAEGSREVVIYTHLDAGTAGLDGVVEVENTRSFVTVEQLVEWCHLAGTRVTIRPVIDLTADLHTDRYEPTPRQREQVVLTHPTCVFPRCTRPSRSCDLDHLDPYAEGGPTDTLNLVPLCRRHHRLKTHARGWHYVMTPDGVLTVTTPSGITRASRPPGMPVEDGAVLRVPAERDPDPPPF